MPFSLPAALTAALSAYSGQQAGKSAWQQENLRLRAAARQEAVTAAMNAWKMQQDQQEQALREATQAETARHNLATEMGRPPTPEDEARTALLKAQAGNITPGTWQPGEYESMLRGLGYQAPPPTNVAIPRVPNLPAAMGGPMGMLGGLGVDALNAAMPQYGQVPSSYPQAPSLQMTREEKIGYAKDVVGEQRKQKESESKIAELMSIADLRDAQAKAATSRAESAALTAEANAIRSYAQGEYYRTQSRYMPKVWESQVTENRAQAGAAGARTAETWQDVRAKGAAYKEGGTPAGVKMPGEAKAGKPPLHPLLGLSLSDLQKEVLRTSDLINRPIVTRDQQGNILKKVSQDDLKHQKNNLHKFQEGIRFMRWEQTQSRVIRQNAAKYPSAWPTMRKALEKDLSGSGVKPSQELLEYLYFNYWKTTGGQ